MSTVGSATGSSSSDNNTEPTTGNGRIAIFKKGQSLLAPRTSQSYPKPEETGELDRSSINLSTTNPASVTFLRQSSVPTTNSARACARTSIKLLSLASAFEEVAAENGGAVSSGGRSSRTVTNDGEATANTNVNAGIASFSRRRSSIQQQQLQQFQQQQQQQSLSSSPSQAVPSGRRQSTSSTSTGVTSSSNRNERNERNDRDVRAATTTAMASALEGTTGAAGAGASEAAAAASPPPLNRPHSTPMLIPITDSQTDLSSRQSPPVVNAHPSLLDTANDDVISSVGGTPVPFIPINNNSNSSSNSISSSSSSSSSSNNSNNNADSSPIDDGAVVPPLMISNDLSLPRPPNTSSSGNSTNTMSANSLSVPSAPATLLFSPTESSNSHKGFFRPIPLQAQAARTTMLASTTATDNSATDATAVPAVFSSKPPAPTIDRRRSLEATSSSMVALASIQPPSSSSSSSSILMTPAPSQRIRASQQRSANSLQTPLPPSSSSSSSSPSSSSSSSPSSSSSSSTSSSSSNMTPRTPSQLPPTLSGGYYNSTSLPAAAAATTSPGDLSSSSSVSASPAAPGFMATTRAVANSRKETGPKAWTEGLRGANDGSHTKPMSAAKVRQLEQQINEQHRVKMDQLKQTHAEELNRKDKEIAEMKLKLEEANSRAKIAEDTIDQIVFDRKQLKYWVEMHAHVNSILNSPLPTSKLMSAFDISPPNMPRVGLAQVAAGGNTFVSTSTFPSSNGSSAYVGEGGQRGDQETSSSTGAGMFSPISSFPASFPATIGSTPIPSISSNNSSTSLSDGSMTIIIPQSGALESSPQLVSPRPPPGFPGTSYTNPNANTSTVHASPPTTSLSINSVGASVGGATSSSGSSSSSITRSRALTTAFAPTAPSSSLSGFLSASSGPYSDASQQQQWMRGMDPQQVDTAMQETEVLLQKARASAYSIVLHSQNMNIYQLQAALRKEKHENQEMKKRLVTVEEERDRRNVAHLEEEKRELATALAKQHTVLTSRIRAYRLLLLHMSVKHYVTTWKLRRGLQRTLRYLSGLVCQVAPYMENEDGSASSLLTDTSPPHSSAIVYEPRRAMLAKAFESGSDIVYGIDIKDAYSRDQTKQPASPTLSSASSPAHPHSASLSQTHSSHLQQQPQQKHGRSGNSEEENSIGSTDDANVSDDDDMNSDAVNYARVNAFSRNVGDHIFNMEMRSLHDESDHQRYRRHQDDDGEEVANRGRHRDSDNIRGRHTNPTHIGDVSFGVNAGHTNVNNRSNSTISSSSSSSSGGCGSGSGMVTKTISTLAASKQANSVEARLQAKLLAESHAELAALASLSTSQATSTLMSRIDDQVAMLSSCVESVIGRVHVLDALRDAYFDANNRANTRLLQAKETMKQMTQTTNESVSNSEQNQRRFEEAKSQIKFLEQELDFFRGESRRLQRIRLSTTVLAKVINKKELLQVMDARVSSLRARVRALKHAENHLVTANRNQLSFFQMQRAQQKTIFNAKNTLDGAKLFVGPPAEWTAPAPPVPNELRLRLGGGATWSKSSNVAQVTSRGASKDVQSTSLSASSSSSSSSSSSGGDDVLPPIRLGTSRVLDHQHRDHSKSAGGGSGGDEDEDRDAADDASMSNFRTMLQQSYQGLHSNQQQQQQQQQHHLQLQRAPSSSSKSSSRTHTPRTGSQFLAPNNSAHHNNHQGNASSNNGGNSSDGHTTSRSAGGMMINVLTPRTPHSGLASNTPTHAPPPSLSASTTPSKPLTSQSEYAVGTSAAHARADGDTDTKSNTLQVFRFNVASANEGNTVGATGTKSGLEASHGGALTSGQPRSLKQNQQLPLQQQSHTSLESERLAKAKALEVAQFQAFQRSMRDARIAPKPEKAARVVGGSKLGSHGM